MFKRIKRKKESWNHRGPTQAGEKKYNDELWHKDCRMLKKKKINYCNMVSNIVYTTMVGKWMNE